MYRWVTNLEIRETGSSEPCDHASTVAIYICARRFLDIIEWYKLSDVITIIIKDNN